jgi:apolipoprotein D and lipocalin family protein
MRVFLVTLLSIIMGGCTGLPENVYPVRDFDTSSYLGQWYEIARLDHSFERGLHNVTAEYSMREDGGLKVLNKGYSTKDNEWKEIEGKAYFVNDPSEGHLKVSFFGPFYGSYVVFELDKDNYQYAFVAGYNKSYLWLLSRSPTVSDEIIERFIKISSELGFDTNGLIFVDHAQPSQ